MSRTVLSVKKIRELIARDGNAPLRGARAFAVCLNLLTEDDEPRERAVFHMLQNGLLDAERIGGQWQSTPNRLLRRVRGEVPKAAA
jgi:hypothetical protein